MPPAHLSGSLRAAVSSSICCSSTIRPSSQALRYLRAVNAASKPTILFVRYASHQAQGRANGPKNSAGKRLGAKKTGGMYLYLIKSEQFVVPGNIIFRQRGTKWFPGENCDMGRDHTIFATQTGFVKYYRDPAKHPKRQYIGVAFERTQTLPTPPNAARRRRLGMLAVPRVEPEIVSEVPNRMELPESYPVPRIVRPSSSLPRLVKAVDGEDALSTLEETLAPRQSRRKNIIIPKQIKTREGHELKMTSNYMFRETNTEIGHAAEKAGVEVRPFVRGDRFLAWRKTTARKARISEKKKMGGKKGKAKGKAKKN